MPEQEAIQQETEAREFYNGAYARLKWTMVVVGTAASLGALLRFGWPMAAGVAIGCAVAALNFLWMKKAIIAFAGRMAEPTPEGEKAVRGSATRFALRYALIAGVAYVIFKSSVISLSGVLVGLFLPVAAILVEAIYETYMAMRHGL